MKSYAKIIFGIIGLLVAVFSIVALSVHADATDRYWVGGTGTWDASDTSHWSATSGGAGGASVPTPTDDVHFDASSGGGTVTITAANALDLDFTGYTGTLAGSGAFDIYGSVTFGAGMTSSYDGEMNFDATDSRNISSNGVQLNNFLFFQGDGGTWTLQDDLNTTASILFDSGSSKTNFNTNDKAVTAREFQKNGTGISTLSLGSSTITLNCGCAPTWILSTNSNLTLNAGTSTIHLTGAASGFFGGGKTYNNLVIDAVNQNAVTIVDANVFNNLTIAGSAHKLINLSINANQTVTGTFTATGNSAINRLLIHTDTIGTPHTITAGTVTLSNADFMDITGAGAAAPFTGISLGDALGNSGITFTAPVTRYWVGDGGNWSDSAHWSDLSGGAGGASVPLPQDTALVDASSITTTGQTITADMPRLGAEADFTTGPVNAPTLGFSSVDTVIYGSLDLAAGMTISGTDALIFSPRSLGNVRSSGVEFTNPVYARALGGAIQLLDDFHSSSSLNLDAGTFNANNFNLTARVFNCENVTTVTMGSGVWTITGPSLSTVSSVTIDAGTSTLVFSGTDVDLFSSKTFNDVVFSGSGTIGIHGSNVFNDLSIQNPPRVVTFGAGTTQTVSSFTASGTSGNLITLQSSSSGTAWNLSKSSGIVSSDYLSLQDAHAIGGASFYAGTHSTNVSGNAGWTFTASPIAGSGTLGDPYLITTCTELQRMNENLSAYYKLYTDINCAETSTWNSGAGFVPVGDNITSFMGHFDGDGKKITNLFISRPSTTYVALFGVTGVATIISNVGITGENIRGQNYVGSLVGYNYSSISNSYSTGSVSGTGAAIGGLVGQNSTGGVVLNTYATASVNSDSSGAGGLVGYNYGSISNSYSTGSVTSDTDSNTGGIVGYADISGAITNSFWNTTTSGKDIHNGCGSALDCSGASGVDDTTMKIESTFTNAGWNFNSIWNIETATNSGYPILRFMPAMSGGGVLGNPYIITSCDQLQAMNDNLSAYYQIGGSDMNCSATTDWNNAAGFVPVGDAGTVSFSGHFDGNSKKITGLFINSSLGTVGLFGYLTGIISNIGLEDENITGSSATGGLVGGSCGTITNSYVTGTVSGVGSYVGGLVGYTGCSGGSISNSYSTANVSSTAGQVGGLVGRNIGASITNSYATGNVEGIDRVGGLVGYNTVSISNSYSTGTVTGHDYVAGFVGINDGSISNSYSTSDTDAIHDDGGGFVGVNSGSISNSYSTGNMSGAPGGLGGFIGDNGGTITNSFWDNQTSGQPINGCNLSSSSCTGLTGEDTITMKTSSTFTGAGWNFESLWNIDGTHTINSGYPYLDPRTNAPSVTTGTSLGTISQTFATLDGNVTSIGTGTLSSEGFHWGLHNGALTETVSTSSGLFSGPYHGNITGLSCNTAYDYQAFAISDVGEGDGTTQSFTSRACALSGAGTSPSPYIINNCAELQSMNDNLSAYYKLNSDIDCSATNISTVSNANYNPSLYNSGAGFVPVGDNATPFTGHFDGNGKKITSLFINRPSSTYIALFGETGGSTTIVNVGTTGEDIRGQDYVGGLVGYNNGGSISNSYSSGSVSGTGGAIGGLVGDNIGGGTISNSYSIANVDSDAGGVGGLVGYNYSVISNSYSAGSTTSDTDSNTGGFIGYANISGTITNSFWDTTTSGKDIHTGCGNVVDCSGASGVDDTAMKIESTFTGAGWNFNSIWNIETAVNSGYPFLRFTPAMTGDGLTSSTQFIITSCDQLQAMNDNLFALYKIGGSDIDCSATSAWNNGAGFSPVGTNSTPFTGHFDGNGKKITGLYINRPSVDWLGMFGSISGFISNVGLESVNITGLAHVGALVGINNGTITTSYSAGSVGGGSAVGGLVGQNEGLISNSYSIASVSASTEAGGLLGFNDIGATIADSYSAGSVSSGSSMGGFLGADNGGTISNSFWDTTTSGKDIHNGCGNALDCSGPMGVDDTAMKIESTFTDAGWNFLSLWDISGGTNNGYPFLRPLSAPSVTTETFGIVIGQTTATFPGTITALGGANVTTTGFLYGTDSELAGAADIHTSDQNINSVPTAFSQSASGLLCGTQYYYQAYAINSVGTTAGGIQAFGTASCHIAGSPFVTTNAATAVTSNSATLGANITDTGTSNITDHGFNWGTDTSYGLAVGNTHHTNTGTYSFGISSLACGTEYHFRAYATNTAGTSYGSDQLFTTLACGSGSPSVTTTSASVVSLTSAALNGTINSVGTSTITNYGFNYGFDTDYSIGTVNSTHHVNTGSYSFNISGLTCSTDYHFRAFATNVSGTSYGSDQSFTTATCDTTPPDTAITSSPTDPSNSASARFTFTGSDAGGSGVASFQCSLDDALFSACTSPQNYTGLSDGLHSFSVFAIDGSGNTDSSPASFTWTIDTVRPTLLSATPSLSLINLASSGPFTETLVFSKSMNTGTAPTIAFTPSTTSLLTFSSGAWSTTSLSNDTYTAAYSLSTSRALESGVAVSITGARDPAGNTIATSAGTSFTVDTIAPYILSAQWSDVNNDTLINAGDTVTVTFREAMTTSSIDDSSFTLGSSHTFDIAHAGTPPAWSTASVLVITLGTSTTVASGDTIVPGSALTDTKTNPAIASPTAVHISDNIPPQVSSIVRVTDSTPTNSATVHYTVTFSEPVTGVDTTDFSLATTGSISGASLASVTPVSSSIYTVLVNTGTGSGTIALRITSSNIIDIGGNALTGLPFVGEVYTIDKSLPTVTINQGNTQSDPTNISPIIFTAVFSEPVTLFTTGDVTLSGTAGANTAVVTDSGDHTTYTISVSGMTTDGTVIASIHAGVAQDSLTNLNSASTSTDNTVTYDTTAPATPTASPTDGTYTGTQTVTLTSAGASQIRYTTDGTITPTCTVGSIFSGSISVSASETIQAIGCDTLGNFSAVASFAYTINAPVVVVSSGGGGGGGGWYLPSTVTTPPASNGIVLCPTGDTFSTATGQRCTAFSPVTTFLFTKSLKLGMIDPQVKELQKYLNAHNFTVATTGPGSIGNETTRFGFATRAALIKFQTANHITPAVGFFGSITKAFVNAH